MRHVFGAGQAKSGRHGDEELQTHLVLLEEARYVSLRRLQVPYPQYDFVHTFIIHGILYYDNMQVGYATKVFEL